jgi:predicted transcriptional regulator
MRTKKIQEILVPYDECVSIIPYVSIDDKLIRAVELMLDHNLERITVIRNNKIIGMIQLKDALEMLGLKSLFEN